MAQERKANMKLILDDKRRHLLKKVVEESGWRTYCRTICGGKCCRSVRGGKCLEEIGHNPKIGCDAVTCMALMCPDLYEKIFGTCGAIQVLSSPSGFYIEIPSLDFKVL